MRYPKPLPVLKQPTVKEIFRLGYLRTDRMIVIWREVPGRVAKLTHPAKHEMSRFRRYCAGLMSMA
jgi:hypothetical protein